MVIQNQKFTGGTHIMGIINVTPDSFYSGSRASVAELLKRAEKMIADGAEVLDLGAQSTRPGHTAVGSAEEIKRLVPALRLLRREFNVPISVDTYLSEVARVALDEGCDMINDIWGLRYSQDMAAVCARYNASVCLMHNQNGNAYRDFWQEITAFLEQSIRLARDAGIGEDKILTDGGIGFGKDREQNFELLNHYERLHCTGYPTLLGASRKSMFGGNVEDRLLPTLRATALAVKKGVLFVRVHDVRENKYAIDNYEEFLV